MNERRVRIARYFANQAAGTDLVGCVADVPLVLVGIDVAGSVSGSPSAASIDVKDDGSEIVTGQSVLANGFTALGPKMIAQNSVITFDVNFTGGSSPAFTGMLHLVALMGG
jgi:hypothetical protein